MKFSIEIPLVLALLFPAEMMAATIQLSLVGEVTSSAADPNAVGDRVDLQLEYDPELFENFDRFAREEDTTYSLTEDDPDGEFRIRVDGDIYAFDQVVSIRIGNNSAFGSLSERTDALSFSNGLTTTSLTTTDPRDIFLPDEPGRRSSNIVLSFDETVSRPQRPDLINRNAVPNEVDDFDFSRAVNGSGTVLKFASNGAVADFLTFSVDPGSVRVREIKDRPQSNFSSANGSPNSSKFSVGGDVGDKLDVDQPTVIVTHGRNPSILGAFSYTGNALDVDSLKDTYNEIKASNPGTNVILLTWEGAFVPPFSVAGGFGGVGGVASSAIGPLADTYQVGVGAASEIVSILGENYKQAIHVVGHSYGSAVNNSLAPELNRLGLDVQQLTVLDAPTDLPVGYVEILRPVDYTMAAISAGVSSFDNYYSTQLLGFGESIENAQLNGGFELDTDHSGVFERYIRSINNPSEIPGGGFSNSVTIREVQPLKIPTELQREFINLGEATLFNSTFDIANSTVSLLEGSDAYVFWNDTNILEFDAFEFTINSLSLGQDDWFEVLLGETTIAFFDGGTVLHGNSVLIPLFEEQYVNGSLTFLLSGNGAVDSSIELSDLRGVNLTANVSAVPLPASAWLLIFSISSLLFVGHRGRWL